MQVGASHDVCFLCRVPWQCNCHVLALVSLHASDGYTCAQRKEWGNCNDDWMVSGDFCAATCGRCGGSDCWDKEVGGKEQTNCAVCHGVPPLPHPPSHCAESWNLYLHVMIPVPIQHMSISHEDARKLNHLPVCADGYTCAQRKEWGNCNDDWMVSGGFCEQTCGRCDSGCQDKEVGGKTYSLPHFAAKAWPLHPVD